MYTDGTYEQDGMTWFVDERNMCAFTEDVATELTECLDVTEALKFCVEYGFLPEDDAEMEEIRNKSKEKVNA